VVFNPFVAVRKVKPFKDADLWYRKPDYQAMEAEIRRTVYHYEKRRNGRATEKGGLCTRGLEDHLLKNPQVVRERRMKSVLIVLLERDRQLEEDGNTPDDEKLASCLKGVSHNSTVRARRRALHDEAVVRRMTEANGTILASNQLFSQTRKILDCATVSNIQENVVHGTSISMLATVNTHYSARLNILRLRELTLNPEFVPGRLADRSTSRLFIPGSPSSKSAPAKLPFRASSRSSFL
jgi:hypothetical protein